MGTVTYKKAPLVELIAEVQWPVQVLNLPGSQPIVSGRSADFDIWFQQLTNIVREQGFHELERLIPYEGSILAGKPLYRYRLASERFPIIQFGHGIFTVNAGPPNYQSWSTFRPRVEDALKALVNSKPSSVKLEGFTRASLRYIDAFDEGLRAGTSNFVFIRDDLGVRMGLPDGLLGVSPSVDEISPSVALRMPVAGDENANLAFQLAAGRVSNSQTTDTIMDMTYSVGRIIEPTSDAVLTVMQSAYETIHGWFEKLTVNLRERMEPTEPV
jgi:uncharacterized protein (TIGR04255 family)